MYHIAFLGGSVDAAAFEPGAELALASLPTPDGAAGRADAGFLIRHSAAFALSSSNN